jgi:hypothetical protein
VAGTTRAYASRRAWWPTWRPSPGMSSSEAGTVLVLSDVSDESLAATVDAVGGGGTDGVATILADMSDPLLVEAVVALAAQRFRAPRHVDQQRRRPLAERTHPQPGG